MTLFTPFKIAFAAVALSANVVTPPAKTLNVVATTPDLGALAEAIGGHTVNVKVLAKPTEDPHFVDAKPSHIVTLNRADLLIDGGAQLEVGWLPALLESARNARLALGQPGRVSASLGVRMLEVPTVADRSQGDVHTSGNPHILLDPENVRVVIVQIAEHMEQLNPSSAATIKANVAGFLATLDAREPVWARTLAPFKGARIVTYHNDFVYLAARYGFEVVGTLEPKPGIAPSPAHLAEVISIMKAQGAHVILVQPYQNRRTAETIARETGATVLDISQQPGAMKGTDTYFDLMDSIVRSLATALQEKK